MKLTTLVIVFFCFSSFRPLLGQKCDSLKVEVSVKSATGGEMGELVFKPAVQGIWQTYLIGPTPDESFTQLDNLSFKDLRKGYYDFYIIDKRKHFCQKHIRAKID